MKISYAALDRIVESERLRDAAYRRKVAGRPLRSSAREWADEALLAKLREFGLEIDRPGLARLGERHLSAEEIARPLVERYEEGAGPMGVEADWIWICLTELWLRWLPDEPCFERLDDRMQAGYDSGDSVQRCRIWLHAWADVLALMDKGDVHTVEDFDERFRGTQFLFNWMGDLERELWSAACQDPALHRRRIEVCRTVLDRFEDLEGLTVENFRRALAESTFEAGERDRVDALYEGWLQADPQWGWGWIGWSDCYGETTTGARDEGRSEELLLRGMAVTGVRDPHHIAERLADLYQRQRRRQEAKRIRRQAKALEAAEHGQMPQGDVVRASTTISFGDEGLPVEGSRSTTRRAARRKIGRNEPCPCGSGLKYKKCCG